MSKVPSSFSMTSASTSVPSGVTMMQETFPFPAPFVFTTKPTSSPMLMVGPMPGPAKQIKWKESRHMTISDTALRNLVMIHLKIYCQ